VYGFSHVAYPSFDDAVVGVLPHDVLSGQVRAPLFAYHSLGRSGHELLEGIALVPFFKLLGHSLFSLKLLYLALTFVSLLCWVFFIKRYQGMEAALIFVAFFTFSPPLFARLNLMTCSRPFVNLMMVIQLMLLFRIFERDEAGKAPWLWLGCGLLAGLGIYTFYTYIIFNVFCLLFLLLWKPGTITLYRILMFLGGLSAGFLPWVLRSLYSKAGGSYLASILQSTSIDLWSFIQNFGFNVPHAFGYHYPSHGMGIVSPLLYLCIMLLGGVMVRDFVHRWRSVRARSFKDKREQMSPALLQGMFFVSFPLFFLTVLSLSPLKIMPFEYWPFIGYFGSFSCADGFRYRWLSSLYPFSFGILAVGLVTFLRLGREYTVWRAGGIVVVAFFLLSGVAAPLKLCKKSDGGKVFYYKGYSYDEMARRFILSDIGFLNLEQARQFTMSYPEEGRAEAYRCLGTRYAQELSDDPQAFEKLASALDETPLPYVGAFIEGVVRMANTLSAKEFQPYEKVLTGRFPALFYEKWGLAHLGRQYYGLLLNWEKIFTYTFPIEEWFFKRFLSGFTDRFRGSNGDVLTRALLEHIAEVPAAHRQAVVRGMGMLVGAEMLFDPQFSPDYPLDSNCGEYLSEDVQDAFYEGIGGGFAETLLRFFRTLLLPEDSTSPLYEKMLDLEWERCQTLMSRVAPLHARLIRSGFLAELEKRELPEGIRNYLQNKQAGFKHAVASGM